jgi:hypothetical protein
MKNIIEKSKFLKLKYWYYTNKNVIILESYIENNNIFIKYQYRNVQKLDIFEIDESLLNFIQ